MSPKTILLAEDDADDRSFFLEFLTHRKDISRISVVKDGEEVFTFLDAAREKAQLPHIIILDQNMPRRNGLHTLHMLKQSSAYKNIPVFMYSTHADENLTKQSLVAGAAGVLAKPFSQEGYQHMMDAVFEALEGETAS